MIELAAVEVWTNPFVVGLVVGAPATLLGFQAYRRAEKLDKEAAQVAVIAAGGEAVQRVIDGLDRMVDNLQRDNQEVRESAADLRERLRECNTAYAELKRITQS